MSEQCKKYQLELTSFNEPAHTFPACSGHSALMLSPSYILVPKDIRPPPTSKQTHMRTYAYALTPTGTAMRWMRLWLRL